MNDDTNKTKQGVDESRTTGSEDVKSQSEVDKQAGSDSDSKNESKDEAKA